MQALVRALAQAAQHVRVAQGAVQRGLARLHGRGPVGLGPVGLRPVRLAVAARHLQRHGGAAARVHQ